MSASGTQGGHNKLTSRREIQERTQGDYKAIYTQALPFIVLHRGRTASATSSQPGKYIIYVKYVSPKMK